MMKRSLQRNWDLGYTLLMIPPFIGVLTLVFDFPRWLEVVAGVAIVALVFFGSRLLFWTRPGWQPSKTLPDPTDER